MSTKHFEKVSELAQRSGFVMWEHEEYGPGPGHVDWSATYDDELESFMTLVVRECVTLCDPQSRIRVLDHFKMSK